MEEKVLIQKLINREHSAYDFLINKYSVFIFRTSLSMVGNSLDAEDITQEVFIEIYNSITRFNHKAKLSTWIYSITKNKSLNLIRSQNTDKRKIFSKTDYLTKEIKEKNRFVAVNYDENSIENIENVTAFYTALSRLPKNLRVAYTLNKLDALSYREVAVNMNISCSAVESLIFRAKNNLKKILTNYYKENF